MTRTVHAAGTVCWRVVDGEVLVAVIHRPHHRDRSWPKGKVEDGEALAVTAVRETREETGLSVSLGVPLGVVRYPLDSGAEKVVQYWAAYAGSGSGVERRFRANAEVSSLDWVPLARAGRRLTYPHDRDVLARFEERVVTGTAATFALVALRHGDAVAPHRFDGPDASRPLTATGRRQAGRDAVVLGAWRPERILSSPARRCRQTVKPLARALERPVREEPAIGQDAWDAGAADLSRVVARRIAKGRSAVLCTHRPVLPDLVRTIAEATGDAFTSGLREAAELEPGGFSVLHVAKNTRTIVGVETHLPLA